MTTYLIAASATKADCLVAGLFTGAALASLGIFIMWAVCNGHDEHLARRAERIVTHPHVSPAATTPAAQEAWERHVAEALAKTEAAVTPLPGRRLAAVPEQGQPGAWS